MKKKLFTAIFLFALSLTTLNAQSTAPAHSVGLSASIQSNQLEILLPIWTSNTFSIAPAFGAIWTEDTGADLALGIVPRFYFYREKFAPYIGAKAGILYAMPNEGDGVIDYILGLSGGGEYFLDDHFSLGVEAQLNIGKSDPKSGRFGAPDRISVNTASAIFATIYF